MDSSGFIHLVTAAAWLVVIAIALTFMLSHMRRMARQFAAVGRELSSAHEGLVFSEQLVATLPEPAQRYFLHVLMPGAKLRAAVRLAVRGHGSFTDKDTWLGFSARVLMIPGRGYTFLARLSGFRGGGSTQFDYFLDGQRDSCYYLHGWLPAVPAPPPSNLPALCSTGRLAGDMLFAPAAFLLDQTIRFEELSENAFAVMGSILGYEYRYILHTHESGAPAQLRMQAWSADSDCWVDQQSGIEIEGEFTCDGVSIPRRVYYGWYQSDQGMCGYNLEFEVHSARWS